MRDEAQRFEAMARAPLAERCEIDVGGEVLFTGSSVEIAGRLVLRIAEDGAGVVVSVEEIGGFVAVINGEDEATVEAAGDFGDPVAGFEAGFSELAFRESDLLGAEIIGDGTGRRRMRDFGEHFSVGGDEDFFQCATLLQDAVDGKSVEKFIGEDAAIGDARRDFDGGAALPYSDELREMGSELVATGG